MCLFSTWNLLTKIIQHQFLSLSFSLAFVCWGNLSGHYVMWIFEWTEDRDFKKLNANGNNRLTDINLNSCKCENLNWSCQFGNFQKKKHPGKKEHDTRYVFVCLQLYTINISKLSASILFCIIQHNHENIAQISIQFLKWTNMIGFFFFDSVPSSSLLIIIF